MKDDPEIHLARSRYNHHLGQLSAEICARRKFYTKNELRLAFPSARQAIINLDILIRWEVNYFLLFNETLQF